MVFVMVVGTQAGVRPAWLGAWAGMTALTYLGFYWALRSGWSERLQDPSMTQWQVVASLMFAGVSYAFLGPIRGVLPGAMLVILCFGMFKLNVRALLGMAALAWCVLAGGVGLHWVLSAGPVDLTLELAHLFAGLVMFTAVGLLAGRLSRIRARLTAQREQLNQALVQIDALAHRDALTGLHNRRMGQELLQQQLLRQRRRPRLPFCVAMLDMDHFKRVNDHHGHAVGDAVLSAFAQTGSATLRQVDTFVRWGGEEFLLLLPDSDLQAAQLALGRLRAAVAAAPVPLGESHLSYTFSVGLTAWREGDDQHALLQRADEALYAAKAAGRNCVSVQT